MKKSLSFLLSLVFSVIFSLSLFAENSAMAANHRTAMRYLQLSKQFAASKNWEEADSNAKMGLAYDDKIADLWYLRAVSQSALGEKKHVLIPLVLTALTDAEWVDYNRDGARILYADLLSQTRRFSQSLEVLDQDPFIFSADAEYIRIKDYYGLNTKESISMARNKIDAARRVYSSDFRFAEVFYINEYQILRQTASIDAEVQRLADAFALMIPLYKKADAELEVLAAIFAPNQEKKVRILKAFNSKGNTSPLYALEALKCGLMDEDSALDYLYQFADTGVNIFVLEDFAALLKSEEAKKEFSEYLNSYDGTISFGTDSDLQVNMTVIYKRGRPQSIYYDENQDDKYEWSAVCDFGEPVTLLMADNTLELEYGSWPYVAAANYKIPESDRNLRFTLLAETLAWSPFEMQSDSSIKNSLNMDFFIPVLSDKNNNRVSGEDLLRSALSYTIPSKEREGAVIQVSLLNGQPQLANYSVYGKVYAIAQFENGIPVGRKVDVDGDGLFETTEYYGFGFDSDNNFSSLEDEMQIMTNLFGSPARGTGFYLKKITVDTNGDTIPDFTEEYIPGTIGAKIPGKVSSWDNNSDGNWDVQYVKQPSGIDGKLREEARFHQPLSSALVTVFSENGKPVSVQKGEDFYTVVQGRNKDFYWISNMGNAKNEEKIISEINQKSEQGVSIIVNDGKNRFLAVRVENLILGMEISESSKLK